jgi:hypothetical protein
LARATVPTISRAAFTVGLRRTLRLANLTGDGPALTTNGMEKEEIRRQRAVRSVRNRRAMQIAVLVFFAATIVAWIYLLTTA